jgi:hypothetical protein
MEKLRSNEFKVSGMLATVTKLTPEELLKMLLDVGVEFNGSIQMTGLTKEELDAQFEE